MNRHNKVDLRLGQMTLDTILDSGMKVGDVYPGTINQPHPHSYDKDQAGYDKWVHDVETIEKPDFYTRIDKIGLMGSSTDPEATFGVIYGSVTPHTDAARAFMLNRHPEARFRVKLNADSKATGVIGVDICDSVAIPATALELLRMCPDSEREGILDSILICHYPLKEGN